ncbi:hypothetical protein AX15_006822 [Amanita polypyramis BW_CC]|nr:hypothetical protein AX15_006822 [Amanita polypyramis BW_CC]
MPLQNNVALLTQSHRAIAAKKRARKEQIREVVFDEEARREFLTGFHKRKVARTEAAKKKALERQKQGRREARNEQRRVLRERAKENAAQVEKAYGGTLTEEEWKGIQEIESDQETEIDHEYEGEEQLATVTVIEDLDPDTFQPNEVKEPPQKSEERPNTIAKGQGKMEKSKKIRYQTKDADLERLRNGDNSASLLGQISASLAAMQRTMDDYDSMAKREMIRAKQEKAQMRVQKFRSDYAELRSQFEVLKEKASADKEATNRAELITNSAIPQSPSDARRRFQPSQHSTLHPGLRPQTEQHSESPFRGSRPNLGFGIREAHALDEHTFLQSAEQRIDDFIAQGREALDNLIDQRNVLKGTQRRLLDAANTLGLSRDVIGWIEKRSTQDMYIFIGGAIFTFFCFYLIWSYLG